MPPHVRPLASLLCLLLSFGAARASAAMPRMSAQTGAIDRAPTQRGTRRTPAARRAHARRSARADNTAAPSRKPDVIFLPTPPETVDEMLRQANLKPGDVLYDLGSGDGRIPIAAAKGYGVRAVGIDIDPALVAQATENARQSGVSDRVTFRRADLFRTDMREATVVTLYLSDSLNIRLRPKLLRELRPGARIISHDFRMGTWKPQRSIRVPWLNLYRTVYVWTVPPRRRAGRER